MSRTYALMFVTLRSGLVAAALTAGQQAAAQQLLASTDSAQPAAVENVARRTSRSALAGGTATRALNLWRGNVRGDITGHATVTLERIGPPDDVLDPVWPVQTRWTVRSITNDRTFAAELYGTVEGSSDCMHLRGIITEGWRKGRRWMWSAGSTERAAPSSYVSCRCEGRGSALRTLRKGVRAPERPAAL